MIAGAGVAHFGGFSCPGGSCPRGGGWRGVDGSSGEASVPPPPRPAVLADNVRLAHQVETLEAQIARRGR